MVTGETDYNSFDGALLIGWDGDCLHWMAVAPDGSVVGHDREEELAALDALAKRFTQIQDVRLSLLRPVCSLMPAAVSAGVEMDVLSLQHGPMNEAFSARTFHSERLGEGVALIESGHWAEDDVFLRAFPMAQWASATLGAIESGLNEARGDAWDATVHIDVGEQRALMMHFRDAALRWCSVTEDLAGDGILYHVVNALHRDGVELESARCKVLFSGLPQDRVLSQFKRFFTSVECDANAVLGSTGLLLHARA